MKPLLVELVRDGRVAYGKAAELLGVSQAEFLAYMAKHKISPFQFTPDELSRELEPIE
jgi:predicted HTH domain antitoxin